MRWWIFGALAALHGLVAARYNDYQSEDGGDFAGLILVVAAFCAFSLTRDAFKQSVNRGCVVATVSIVGLILIWDYWWAQAAFVALVAYGLISDSIDRRRRRRRL